MPYLFDHLHLIEELLRQSPFGLITDVDGTISPTAPTPQEARVSPLCHHYLSILCHRLALVAAISGRPAAGVRDMVGIDGLVYIGNHGLERWTEGHSEFREDVRGYSAIIKEAVDELAPLLASIEGLSIENKGVTATLHYRLCRKPQLAEKRILTALGNSPRARRLHIMQEKMAIDLLPPVEANKGTATRNLIEEYSLQGAIYLGDDTSDIAAFRAIQTAAHDLDFRGLAIGIINRETPEELATEVDFTLNEVSDVERFLEWISRTI